VIGFNEMLDKSLTIDKKIEIIAQKTRNYAKRQLTWIRNKFQDFNEIEK
jgi:tRNA A37 N6-isopentenylltransferase MiaA